MQIYVKLWYIYRYSYIYIYIEHAVKKYQLINDAYGKSLLEENFGK